MNDDYNENFARADLPVPEDDFDHGILSPSGHVSKRTRQATLAKLLEAKRPEFLRQQAADLRALAARGMQPRKLTAQAAKLEAEADALEAGQCQCSP